MPSDLANLEAARSAAIVRLRAAMETAGAPGYNPNAPENADHDGFVARLRETIAFFDKEISKFDVFEYTSEMYA